MRRSSASVGMSAIDAATKLTPAVCRPERTGPGVRQERHFCVNPEYRPMKTPNSICLFPVFLLGLAPLQSFAADPSYHFLTEIPVAGEGGWDYLSVDTAARRLYVSHGTSVAVIDLDN